MLPLRMDAQQVAATLDSLWARSVVPTLERYIRIPNQSPLFDPDWKRNGHMNQAVTLAREWVEGQQVRGLKSEIIESDGRTPLLWIEVPGDPASTILMYGHLDKQPAMVGWDPGLGPWTPVLRDGRLYGRGGADDGYAVFSAVSAVRALQEQKIAHSRIVMIIECDEESGSTDLPAYIEQLSASIGTPRLIVCLDSGC
jgi:acetylornithine deacetylase/succinyl-diaminopimelate desuccinylase-like protein